MNYTLYVCWKTGTVNIVANCIATVDNDFSMLALSLSPAPSSFGHGRFCGAIIKNFGLLLIIVECLIISSHSWQYLIMPSCCRQYLSTANWMVFWTCWPGPLWKISSSSEAFEENELLTRDLWLLVIPFAGVTPLAHLQNLHHPQSCCRLGPLLRNSHCPKPVQMSGLGTRTHLSYTHSSQTAYWGNPIQSGLLIRTWNWWSHSDTPYISAL